MNNHFSTIADKIRKRIVHSIKHFTSFLRDSNQNSIFLNPTSPEEVFKFINTLNDNKSSGPCSVPDKIFRNYR